MTEFPKLQPVPVQRQIARRIADNVAEDLGYRREAAVIDMIACGIGDSTIHVYCLYDGADEIREYGDRVRSRVTGTVEQYKESAFYGPTLGGKELIITEIPWKEEVGEALKRIPKSASAEDVFRLPLSLNGGTLLRNLIPDKQ